MNMYNPPHPGSLVKHECLEALGLNVTDGASVLGVSRQALSNIVNEKAGISPEMAIRLEKAFGGTAETWLRMQMNFDIWHAKQRADDIHVERYEVV
ncbi:MAG: HigA family addiction module antitoxin [Verrucomicrobia bacterium]|nr:HigA family addiction module antitoxin [Verrucomicrobiota bacterium]MDA1065894.1 HigA family addiction module antitoxin [Verrucomicrobiota bacterium]